MKKKKKNTDNLTAYEQDILNNARSGNYTIISKKELEEKLKYNKLDSSMSLRINSDLKDELKNVADELGVDYQVMIRELFTSFIKGQKKR